VNIDFGIVKKYFSDRGFGFVTRTFLSSCQSEVFFHIRNVKKTRADLAEKLTKYESTDSIWFWYDTEITSKGEQVHRILDSGEIQKMDFDNLPKIIDRIEVIWADVDSNMPDWLQEVTLDLLGTDRVEELSLERDVLEKEIRKIEKKRQKQLKKVKIQKDIEEKEFEQLVAEMKVLGITESKDVSRHIMRNKLGHKYKNISGIVKMEHDGTVWDFKGGFPPQIYARLCNELGLRNQGTRARALSFKAFKDL
jgi:cell division protein FtsI/penicillin-binding protein 2